MSDICWRPGVPLRTFFGVALHLARKSKVQSTRKISSTLCFNSSEIRTRDLDSTKILDAGLTTLSLTRQIRCRYQFPMYSLCSNMTQLCCKSTGCQSRLAEKFASTKGKKHSRQNFIFSIEANELLGKEAEGREKKKNLLVNTKYTDVSLGSHGKIPFRREG